MCKFLFCAKIPSEMVESLFGEIVTWCGFVLNKITQENLFQFSVASKPDFKKEGIKKKNDIFTPILLLEKQERGIGKLHAIIDGSSLTNVWVGFKTGRRKDRFFLKKW